MITPWRVTFFALILGVGMAIMVSMRTPPPPPEETATEVSTPPASQQPPRSYVEGPALTPTSQPSQPTAKLADGPRTKTASGLTIIEVKASSGVAAKMGDAVEVHYIGRLLQDGSQFDSSYDRGRPLAMTLTDGGGIKGFIEGVTGMKVGEKRELIIPSDLAYGERGVPRAHIPPNAALVFDVEMMSIQPGQ